MGMQLRDWDGYSKWNDRTVFLLFSALDDEIKQ
jgi:hypothetical protein